MSRYLAIAVFLLLCQPVSAQNAPPPPVPLTIEAIAPDTYVVRGEGGNTTVIVSDEGVLLVDVKFERNFNDLVAKIKSVTDKPVKYVINSHSHGDHTGGNQKFQDASAVIIAHKNARAAMITGKQPGPPQITYTDQFGLQLGGREVIARYFGRAHTDGDTWVSLPAQRILITGDSFNTADGRGLNPTNSVTYAFFVAPGGSFQEVTQTLDAVLKEDFDIAIPGHGPVAKKADVLRWRNEIEKLRTRVTSMVREGKSTAEVHKMLVAEFGWDPTLDPVRRIQPLLDQVRR